VGCTHPTLEWDDALVRELHSKAIRAAMPSLEESFPTLVRIPADHEGSAGPVRARAQPQAFASILGVVISRADEATRLARVVQGLEAAGLLEPEALAAAEPMEIVDALRGAGVKLPAKTATMFKRLARWFADRGGSENLGGRSTDMLRDELASIKGVGRATADAILLNALGRPTYPVDRGTYRILLRHGWIDVTADYDEVSQLMTRRAGERPDELARLSRGLARLAHQYCKVGAPRCTSCPLRSVLPEDGPLEPEG
jgi:endonuclease-3 related protein